MAKVGKSKSDQGSIGGKEIKNLAASVKARLLNIARGLDRDFNLILRQYVQERFLYRLANSQYSKYFILKGALLFLAHNISALRPTRDIDFKGDSIVNDIEELKKIFEEVILVESNDGLIFNNKSLQAEEIVEDGEYHGIRVKLNAHLGKAAQNLQIDIGFGDKVYKGSVEIEYPVLLDQPAPKILAYSIESAIAEKFEAIVSIGIATSRMKDFYDILFFAGQNIFNSTDLYEAINLTFKNRKTDLQERTSVYEIFKEDRQKQIQWSAFLKKNKLKAENEFSVVVDKIQNFVEPIFELKESKQWNPENWNWE